MISLGSATPHASRRFHMRRRDPAAESQSPGGGDPQVEFIETDAGESMSSFECASIHPRQRRARDRTLVLYHFLLWRNSPRLLDLLRLLVRRRRRRPDRPLPTPIHSQAPLIAQTPDRLVLRVVCGVRGFRQRRQPWTWRWNQRYLPVGRWHTFSMVRETHLGLRDHHHRPAIQF